MSTQGDISNLPASSPEASLLSDLRAWALFGTMLGVGNALTFGFIFRNGFIGVLRAARATPQVADPPRWVVTSVLVMGHYGLRKG